MRYKLADFKIRNNLLYILIISISLYACIDDEKETGEVVRSNCVDENQNIKPLKFGEHWIYFTTGFETDTISLLFEEEHIDTVISTDYSLGLAFNTVIPKNVRLIYIHYREKEYKVRIMEDYCFVYLGVKSGVFNVCYTNSTRNFY